MPLRAAVLAGAENEQLNRLVEDAPAVLNVTVNDERRQRAIPVRV